MHIEFLVEDSSGARLVEILAPKLIGGQGNSHTWKVRPYRGVGRIPKDLKAKGDPSKRVLLNILPKILRGYSRTPGIDRIVVLLDLDRKSCVRFLEELTALASECGRTDTMFRIAIEEIEAWYLADHNAIRLAYKTAKLGAAQHYQQDSICGTWELLADVLHPGGIRAISKSGHPLPGDLKHEWAAKIGPLLDVENSTSPSFRKFCEGVRRIAQ